MVDLSHAGNLGRVQTLFSGSFSVGVAISAFVFGRVIERFGYPTAFLAAASCVVLGIGLIWMAPDRDVAEGDEVLAPAERRESQIA